ncbi:hypothetical protein HYS82_01030 [Candidatus Amesbacteria bacterium]|nr:hypothetical protein [Candidatus Amesbacteria bacterium]
MKFYDKLIFIDEITSELEESEDREELITIIRETFHHHVLDIILTHLPRSHTVAPLSPGYPHPMPSSPYTT